MHIQRGFQQPDQYRGGWVTIGNFDGVHRGHQSMLAKLVQQAHAARTPAVVMTFDPHPIALLRPQQTPPALSLLDHKLKLFEQHGIDAVVIYPTDHAAATHAGRVLPKDRARRIERGRLSRRAQFLFGHHRAGNVGTLKSLCDAADRTLEVVPAVIVNGRMISSSEVRSRIAAGQIAEAVEMLGHPYRVRGSSVPVLPEGGPLVSRRPIWRRLRPCCRPMEFMPDVARSMGPRIPSQLTSVPIRHSGGRSEVRAHLLGFTGDLYGQTLDVDLLARVRDVVRFESSDALKQQLNQDLETVRTLANEA